MTTKPLFEVRVVIKHTDPQKESQLVKNIASEFLRMGVRKVTVIADDQHVNYVDGEVYNATTGDLFGTNPAAKVDAFVVGHSSSIN